MASPFILFEVSSALSSFLGGLLSSWHGAFAARRRERSGKLLHCVCVYVWIILKERNGRILMIKSNIFGD